MCKKNLLLLAMAVCLCLGMFSQVVAEGLDAACRAAQREVQATVGNEDPDVYRNHGAYVSAAAHAANVFLYAGEIDSICHSCIVSQFARRIPIEEQEPCGPEGGEVRNLLGPEETACDGPVVGTISIADLGAAGLEVRVEFVSGPPNLTADVFWTCTDVANGCHDAACGYISIGQITTDGAGQGVLTVTLANGNPYPGKYVHFDMGGGPWYTSVWDIIFPSLSAGAGAAPSPTADPKNR